MKARSWFALFALGGFLTFAHEAAAQRVPNPAAGGRMPNPAGSRFAPPMSGSINFGGARPLNSGFYSGMGSIGYSGNYWRNNQGLQPGNFQVPFTYTPGYRWYSGRLPAGYYRGGWGGVPYFWYNNMWYRSMWWRGLPQFIPVPINTVPPQVQQQWNEWYKLQQEQLKQAIEQQERQQKDKANQKKDK